MREDERVATERLADATGELLDADRLGQPASLPDLAERLLDVHPERVGEQGVVADLGVRVERQVVRSQVQVGSEERLEAATLAPVDPDRLVPPEHAVVHDHELSAGRRRPLEELERGRDSARDLRHLVGAEHLQTGRAVLGEAVDLEQFVRVPDDLVALGHGLDYRYPLRARGVAQPGSALRSGRRGPEFESPHPDERGGTAWFPHESPELPPPKKRYVRTLPCAPKVTRGWTSSSRPRALLVICCLCAALVPGLGCMGEDETELTASETKTFAGLEARLREAASMDEFTGAVLVARDGHVLFRKAYGLADREQRIANTLQTRFRIGSMNKMFTAVAILQLVEAGRVDLMAPLGTYIPDYPNRDIATKVTIHHLLTHTGGTGDIFGPDFEAHRNELRTLADYLKLYGERGLEFEPGSTWAYSNYGMVLLGVVIEKVTDQSYYEYVQERVYEPAGMTATGSLPEDEEVPGRSIGYTRPPGSTAWAPNTDSLPYRGTSAGGGYSTVEDLGRFAHALLGDELLSPESTELLLTGKVDSFGGMYAYGFEDRQSGGNRSVGHGGGAPGMNGDLPDLPGVRVRGCSTREHGPAGSARSIGLSRLPTSIDAMSIARTSSPTRLELHGCLGRLGARRVLDAPERPVGREPLTHDEPERRV